MTLLLAPGDAARRRAAARGALAPLADSLAADLAPVVGGELFVPLEKARLSRAGGRCPADGATLDFEPQSPRAHRCPVCGRVYDDEAHYRSWVMWYQLWLAERAVHAAALHLLREEPGCARFADAVLARYAELYLRYPNRDNVLGPTRPFFSTYLESIWLLQLAVALDLREAAGDVSRSLAGDVRARVAEPSAALIASYDEGGSNRQVWNAAALLAAARLLDDPRRAERAVYGPSGLVEQLERGLLDDGTWYEGDNYHQFAHRGLWYGVALAEVAGLALPAPLVARFAAGFAAPFVSALPDLTFPSRRDSQYAVSLRQWRFAEMAELGLARGDDERLAGALAELYAGDLPRRDTGRSRSAAESERNAPASSLSRADLGWRSLLFARETLPPLAPLPRRSVLLDAQGLAILRRDQGRVYAALDYGRSGGGHGHADRLNLLLSDGATRWLDDVGTGSYVDRSLHWYRSTLAHSAPLVDGHSQQPVDGVLRAFEERGGAGWVDAEARVAPGALARRAVVVMPDYLVDELTWEAERESTLDLPLHADGELEPVDGWEPAALSGGGGREDGFDFVERAERARGAPASVRLRATAPDASAAAADVWVVADAAEGARPEWWRAVAPGPPGAAERRFHLVRLRAPRGRITSVWSWRGAVRRVTRDALGTLVVELARGDRHEHRREGDGWRAALWGGGASSSIELGGAVPRPAPASAGSEPASDAAPPPLDTIPRLGELPPLAEAPPAGALVVALGEREYRRSEQSWREAGAPSADLALLAHADALVVEVRVPRSALRFAPAGAVNEMDNEHPDVNGDGVQLHLASADGRSVAGWRIVPEWPEGRVRVSPVAGTDAAAVAPPPAAEWRPWRTGYLVRCVVPLGELGGAAPAALRLDVVVNETAPGRERRRGQLVLSGARSEFVYLRGDRQPLDRLVTFAIAAPAATPAHV
ncbi:MAG: heparinase II/III family protein [Gemmatimonadaceae bacterium]